MRRGRQTWSGLASSRLPRPVWRSSRTLCRLLPRGLYGGSIHAHGFLHNAVVLSDDAGQFDIGQHALCWVHAERLVHKLDTFTDLHRAAQQRIRMLIWNFYAELKTYRANHSKKPSCGAARPVRSHLPPSHRIRHAGSIAEAASCQQDRFAEGAGAAGNPAAHQRLRERHPLSGDPPQGQRRNTSDAGREVLIACSTHFVTNSSSELVKMSAPIAARRPHLANYSKSVSAGRYPIRHPGTGPPASWPVEHQTVLQCSPRACRIPFARIVCKTPPQRPSRPIPIRTIPRGSAMRVGSNIYQPNPDGPRRYASKTP